MSTPVEDLEETVREALAEAEANGQPTPGRPTLVKRTGATDYQIRKVLEKLTAPARDDRFSGDLTEWDAPESAAGEALTTDGDEVSPADRQDSPTAATVPPADTTEPRENENGVHSMRTPDGILVGTGEPLATADTTAGDSTASPTPAPVHRIGAVLRGVQWPLLIIGLGAAVAVWSGWVGLGQMAGFGLIQPLPGIVDDLRINTAVVLPLSVEAYAAYALRCWLGTSQYSRRTTEFAKWSAIASLVIGAGAQVAYHLMVAAGMTRAPWQITTLVAVIPVMVLGLASALAKLVTSDRQHTANAGDSPPAVTDNGDE